MTWRGSQREAARQVTSDRIPFIKQVAGVRPLVQVCSLPFAWTISYCERFFSRLQKHYVKWLVTVLYLAVTMHYSLI